MEKAVKFFAGRNTKTLACKIAESFGSKISSLSIVEFSDGEFEPSFDETCNSNILYYIIIYFILEIFT